MQTVFLIGVIVFLSLGWLQQRLVDNWNRRTGRAPMISKGRGSWAAYMRMAGPEMPFSLRRKLRFLSSLTWVVLILTMLATFVGEKR